MKKPFLISFVLLIFCNCSIKEEAIYILPKDYTGYVIMLYDQKDGAEKKYEGNKRVYKIPPSGILKTQFEADYGWAELPEFYYEDMEGNKKIPYRLDFKEVPSDSIVSFGGTTGTANRDLEGNSVVNFSIYYIGNKEQIQAAIDEADSFDYIKLADDN